MLGALDRHNQVFGRFFAHAFQRLQLLRAQPVKVRGRVDKALPHQQLQHRGTEALDIHRVTGAEMDENPHQLRGAFRIVAAQGGFALLPVHGRSAGGANLRHFIRRGIRPV